MDIHCDCYVLSLLRDSHYRHHLSVSLWCRDGSSLMTHLCVPLLVLISEGWVSVMPSTCQSRLIISNPVFLGWLWQHRFAYMEHGTPDTQIAHSTLWGYGEWSICHLYISIFLTISSHGNGILTLNMLNCLKNDKTFCIISWIVFNRRPNSQWINPPNCLPYTVNTMAP